MFVRDQICAADSGPTAFTRPFTCAFPLRFGKSACAARDTIIRESNALTFMP